MAPMNTWFQKPKPKLATYRNATTPSFNLEQIDVTKFAQIDYVLINSAWRNAITNIENVHHTIINSDHALLIASLKVKLAIKKKIKYRPISNIESQHQHKWTHTMNPLGN